MNTIHKIMKQKKHVVHPLLTEQHNDVVDVITQKSQLKYKLQYDTW